MGTAFDSALGKLLGESEFLQVETPRMTGPYRRIPDIARQHLFTFLGTPPSETFDELLQEGFKPAPSFIYSVNSRCQHVQYSRLEADRRLPHRAPRGLRIREVYTRAHGQGPADGPDRAGAAGCPSGRSD